MRHKKTSLTPLTDEERQFASENHYMIEDFLKYNRLSRNEWYDVVVFRYLLTVQKWFRRPELHRYPFVSLARRGMSSAVYNERLKQVERRIQTVSLDDIVPGTEDLRLIDTITEENLNFVIYVEGEDMNISYDVMVPERSQRKIGIKSDETIAIESFLEQKKTKNMRIEYETPEEAKKKLASIQYYQRKHKLKEVIEVFRVESNIYVVRVKKEEKQVESIKINKLEIENVKRIKAVKIEPTKDGLTIVGGNNNQGKTSVLDSIAWALGGDRFKPSQPVREGSAIPPNLHIVMNNGLIVERKGKNSSLKVTDPEGNKGGQQLLNEFVEQLALDLPRFMESSGREKADTLLQIIGVGEQLNELEVKETEAYNQRRAVGQIADQKEKYAKEQPYYPDAPKELISPSELIRQQQEILAKNGENQRKRENLENLRNSYKRLSEQIKELRERLKVLETEEKTLYADIETAQKSVADLQDESTAELESSISNIEEINRKVRANLDKDKAEEDALSYRNQYASLTEEINDTRQAKTDLLKSAELPLPELSVMDGELVYKGQKWDNMSGSDRLKVSTAIVRKLNPKCGFVLLDKLEQMDMQTLQEFGRWLKEEGLQAIATRVSTGEECSIIIEDGYVKGQESQTEGEQKPVQTSVSWKEGEF